MPQPVRLTTAERLRAVGSRLFALADRFEVPSETTTRAERLIGEVEEALEDGRAAVRGPR